MKRLLIFDAYGTLFSTGNGSIEATRKILSLQDKVIDAATFYKDWKNIHRKLFLLVIRWLMILKGLSVRELLRF